MKRLSCLLLLCTLSISSTAHAAEIRTVALSGQQIPGLPDGTIFTSFQGFALVLNDAGQTAFRAYDSDSNFIPGVWSEGAGSLNLVAAVGQQAPGLPDGVTYVELQNPNRQVINDAGSTAFSGRFSGGGSGGIGFWSSGPGGSALIVRSGEQAAGTPAGVTYGSFGGFDHADSLVMNDAGQTAFMAELVGPGVDLFTNGTGIWSGVSGNLALVARAGNHAPGEPIGVNYSSLPFVTPALNNACQTAFHARLTGGGVNEGIWSEGSGSLALVARTGDHAPGTPDGVNYGSFTAPALNGAGQTAFRAFLIGSGVDSTNDGGIWSEASGNLALVARDGDHAPGTPIGVNYGSDAFTATFSRLVLNDAGQTAFFANLTGSNVNFSNDRGIWSEGSGSLALLAREGSQVPGTSSGVNFYEDSFVSFSSPVLNDAGQTAFIAHLTGVGVDGTNNRGIWATDRAGDLQLVAREGDLLEVAPGDLRTMNSLVFVPQIFDFSTGNSDGRPSAFNNRGQLAFSATFTDGTSGIFVSNRVAVPEPSTLLLLGLTTAGVLLRRRR